MIPFPDLIADGATVRLSNPDNTVKGAELAKVLRAFGDDTAHDLAKLFAAAPDLLNAAKQAVDQFERIEQKPAIESGNVVWRDLAAAVEKYDVPSRATAPDTGG